MRGRDAIAKALADQGIDTMFGVLGDGNLFIAEAMLRNHGLRFVAATHEANGICMAEGWAKITGQLGVATVTHGPGLTNTATALVEGVRNRTPMLVIAGDTPRGARDHPQFLNQQAFVESTGAGFEPIEQLEAAARNVANAVRRAHAERRPIVLNIPLDLQRAYDVELAAVEPIHRPGRALEPDPEALDIAVGILASAARPLIIAGKGAVQSGAHDALVRLAEQLGAPLATSVLGTGYFRGDPWNVGIFGTLAHEIATEVIAEADCVISFGAALGRHTTDGGQLLQGKAVIQIDLDPERVGSTVPITAGVVGDAKRTAETISQWLDDAGHQPGSFRSSALAERLSTFDPLNAHIDKSTATAMDPRTVSARLDVILPADRTLVVDTGRFMRDALRLSVPDPLSLVTTHAFASIGLGLSNAIGAAVGRPQRPTVLAIGDGGFMMGALAEFHTAVENNLDLIVMLYNDGSYGAEHIQLYREGLDTKPSLHHWPEFGPVLTALGADVVQINTLDDIDRVEAVLADRQPGRPVVIEIRLDPDLVSSIPR